MLVEAVDVMMPSSSIFHGALAMDPLKVSEVKMVVYRHNSKTKVVSEFIKRERSSHLFKCVSFSLCLPSLALSNNCFKDVVSKPLSFNVFRCEFSDTFDGFFYWHMRLLKFQVNLQKFCLEGRVVKIARESIHVVVLGFSAAVITEEDILDEFKFKIKNGQETYHSTSHKGHVIKVGTMIRFLVKSFNEEILHFSGSLIPASTGSIRWLSKNLEEASRNSHKRRESEGRREEISAGTVDGGALSDEYHVLKKPRKRNVREGSERTE
ncbi:hypothetical protein Cgig2_025722 [Carnegiea gigantea]|uniref:Uncharacterized protein n=1 Tax=Carnegiea gigantea TaxID=171969 RepID=A0A9Q1JR40_9CARY|nr:hypothetical protein Cgig2_025722 [Carnegiea gigantea]